MDFYWGERAERPVEGGALNPRWLIFEILNLSAALFAYDQDRPIASDAWPQMEKHNRALQSAINLTTEVYNLGHQVLKEASTMTPNIVSLALNLSNYLIYCMIRHLSNWQQKYLVSISISRLL